jgi:hypothetical protein
LLGAVVLAAALAALRYGVIEKQLLPRDCGPAGGDSPWFCGAAWLLVESFRFQRIGWAALACGLLGFAFSWRRCAWVGWYLGFAGLVLYSPDYAAVGGLLALFTLLRPELRPERAACPGLPSGERGQAKCKPGQ